ncbi:putative methyltransferase NSUN7 [Archocentrus centrarchus]|uniref:putative methyltransferase NSUN7 n=1 Tax=Archocentrus centrarchus TaxID=63155 RepID=UPI0011EA2577|nr:putative methyltransferase NSUN7 [Archocentrus centrarchus]
MSVVPMRRVLNDKVGPGEDVNTSSAMEKVINKEPFSSLLPRLQSSSRSTVYHPSDQVYLQSAAIFQQLRSKKPASHHQHLHYGEKAETPLLSGGGKPAEKQAYQLAFNTLKYQDLLEDIIADSCFHTSQHISDDLLPLAMVMLFDFQDRRFVSCERPTIKGQETIQEVRNLERSLQRCKTKLAASLARCRVKQNLQSVSCFLSDSVRMKQQQAKGLPLYAWVNTLKISLEEMCEAVQSAGLCQADNVTDLKESTFCLDPLCPDTLIFSQHLQAQLQHSSLTTTHVLNIQDRSVCVAVSVLRPLLFDKSDVLLVGAFSAVTVAHAAVVAAARAVRVLLCGADHTPSHIEEIQELLTQMGLKNVRVLSQAFRGLGEWDATMQRVKVIMVLPQCSSSALNDPVASIHSEHGDWSLLPELSHGSVSKSKINSLTTQQVQLLAHALTFPKVQTVVYCTRSVYPEENEQLVKRVLEKTHTHPKLLPYRVNGPIFPDDTPSGGEMDSHKFFRLKPSKLTNGCFVARLSRQADPTKVETVQDVLARAVAKGLLGGMIPEQSKPAKKGKRKKNRVASATSKHSSRSSLDRETGGELVNGRDPFTPSEDEEEKGEEDSRDGEEEEEKVGEKEDDKEKKGEKKRKGHKGRKQKRHAKQSKRTAVSTDEPKGHKETNKKQTKKKVSQSHIKRRQMKNKPRRIPRLTLALISSAKPSNLLSPITALAHRMSINPAFKSQQTLLSSPSPAGKHPSPALPAIPTPHTASKRQNTQPERAEEVLTDAAKPVRAVVRAENERLPPISSISSNSLRSKSGSSLYRPPSGTSNSPLGNMSTCSSSISLPGL